MKFEINPEQLYLTGIICFSIIGISNLINLILHFSNYIIWGKFASIGSIIFNFALVGLFNYLLGLEPKVKYSEKSDDIDKIIKEVSKKK